MKWIDRVLQRWRIRRALASLPPGASRVIDIGAFEGELFLGLGDRLAEGFGIEPLLRLPLQGPRFSIHPGFFPEVRPASADWDAITLLAVLEHIPEKDQGALADACHALLKAGGRVIITVPSPFVDHILKLLTTLRLIDGMSLEEHFGFSPADTVRIFSAPRFKLVRHRRFQLGLNHLYVFEKQSADRS